MDTVMESFYVREMFFLMVNKPKTVEYNMLTIEAETKLTYCNRF